jgi:hypothetical protein
MNHQERIENLNRHIEQGTLIRKAWGDGHKRACLLAALAPETAQASSSKACPAEVMPEWLAHLTPSMDDYGTAEAWPAMVRRYAELASRWHVLSADQWSRLDYQARIVALKECRDHAPEVVDRVIELCERAASGDMPSHGEWVDAAAEAAAEAAARAAARAARAAETAAEAAWAAARAASATWAAGAAARAAGAAAGAASTVWDRMTSAILDVIESEIEKAERDAAG